jgi:regulator of nucleoside diphosphate kinase
MPNISISETDFVKLNRLLQFESNWDLEHELSRAEVINCILVPPTLVTMESDILYIDHTDKKEKESLLVYSRCPLDQDRVVSVLSPLGTALLGLEVGQKIKWFIDGREKILEIIEVLTQPEATGVPHPLTFNNEFHQTQF